MGGLHYRARKWVRRLCIISSFSLVFFSLTPSFTRASVTSGTELRHTRAAETTDELWTNRMASSDRFDMANWTIGQVTLAQAFGISKGTVSFPKLQAKIPAAAGSAKASQSTQSGGPAPTVGNSGAYSFKQLEQIWVDAGGNPAKKTIAAAIAMAESSGEPNAQDDDSNGTVDRGLWQINSVHGSQSTYNVMQNARSAIAISSNGTDWSAWSTFNNGAYLQFMPGGHG